MLPFSALASRAVLAASSLAAFAPAAARKKKRRKPKPPPEPLAHLAITVRDVVNYASNGDRGFGWTYDAWLRHPASGFTKDMRISTTTAVTASLAQTRAQIARTGRTNARIFLAQAGHNVPEDRIAVVLL